MQNDNQPPVWEFFPGERQNKEVSPEEQAELDKKAAMWEQQMADAPAFAGDAIAETNEMSVDGKDYSSASNLETEFNTLTRIYNFETVVNEIDKIDETDLSTGVNAFDKLCNNLAENDAEEAHFIHQEIKKDQEKSTRPDDLYTLKAADANHAIASTKKLFQVLREDKEFADIREKAAEDGQDIIAYLSRSQTRPAFSQLFESISRTGEIDKEAVLEAIEQDEPEETEAPETPEAPEIPDTPETPEEPETPETPDTPVEMPIETPETPETTETTFTPDTTIFGTMPEPEPERTLDTPDQDSIISTRPEESTNQDDEIVTLDPGLLA